MSKPMTDEHLTQIRQFFGERCPNRSEELTLEYSQELLAEIDRLRERIKDLEAATDLPQ